VLYRPIASRVSSLTKRGFARSYWENLSFEAETKKRSEAIVRH
jgi:hypothetical protein